MILMAAFEPHMPLNELLQIAADHHHKRQVLSDADRKSLIDLLKRRGMEELEYGEEREVDSVRLLRRVTGAVGVYFS